MNKLEIDELNIEKKLNKAKPINDMSMSLDQIEKELEPIGSRLEAEACLRKVGVQILGKSGGEIMLLAANHGLINVIKYLQGP